jgi:hypothetical protein
VSWNCCLMDLSVVGQMFSKHHILLHTCQRTHSETFRCEFVQSKQWSPEIHWILLGEEANTDFVSSFVCIWGDSDEGSPGQPTWWYHGDAGPSVSPI